MIYQFFFCWESDESRGRLRLTRAITILQAPVGHPQRLARVFGGMHFFHRETWSARRADISSVATVDLRMSAALAAGTNYKAEKLKICSNTFRCSLFKKFGFLRMKADCRNSISEMSSSAVA
jgi:hypothetical protein